MAAILELKFFNSFWLKKLDTIVDEKNMLEERTTSQSQLIDRNDPETQQVIGILMDARQKGDSNPPTDKEILAGLNALRQTRSIKKNLRKK